MRERDLSRFEGDFDAAGDAPLSKPELLDLLAACSRAPNREGRDAIACYLSAGAGWQEALQSLRGAFADDAAAAVQLGSKPQDKHDVNQRASEYLQWPALKDAGSDND